MIPANLTHLDDRACNRPYGLGISANASGAHTCELTAAVAAVCAWTGVRPHVIWRDDDREPSQAREVAKAFAHDCVAAVIGHLSASASVAAAPVYRDANLVLMAPATSHGDLTALGGGRVLRAFGSDETGARLIVSAIMGAGEFRTVTIIVQDAAYGRSLADHVAMQLSAIGIAPQEILLRTDQSLVGGYRRSGGPEAVVIAGIHEFAASVIRSLRASGFDGPVFLGDDAFTGNFVRLAGPAAEGAFVTVELPPSLQDPGFADVMAGLPDPVRIDEGYATHCAIAAYVLISAIEQGSWLRGLSLANLIQSRPWNTPFGWVRFDGSGALLDLSRRTFRIANGNFVEVGINSIPCASKDGNHPPRQEVGDAR